MNAQLRQFHESATPLAPAQSALIAGQLEAELAVLGQMEVHCRQLLVERAGAVATASDPVAARETLDAIDLQRQRLEHQRQETLAILQPLAVGPVRLSRLIARADAAGQVRLGQLRTAVLETGLPAPTWVKGVEIRPIDRRAVRAKRFVYSSSSAVYGETGTGDGKIAALLVFKPINLTQLSKQHKGEFPFWRVYRAIDGRDFVRGHGNREMPLWGFVFQVEEDATGNSEQFDTVRGRIWQLVYYLESIQER